MTTDENQMVGLFSLMRDFLKTKLRYQNIRLTPTSVYCSFLLICLMTFFFYSYFMHRKEKNSIEIEQKRQSLEKLVRDEEDEFEADCQDESQFNDLE
jgi:hypothetical protein